MSPRPSRTSLAVAVSAMVSTTLLLTGCGSTPAPTGDGRVAVVDGTQRAASVEEPEVDPDLVALVDALRGAAQDVTTTRFRLAVRGPQRVDVTGQLDVTTPTPTLRARVLPADLGLREVRVVDGTAYGLVGFSGLPADWVRVPLPDLADLTGLGGSGGSGGRHSLGGTETFAEQLAEVVTGVERDASASGTTYTAVLELREVADLLSMAAGTLEVPGMPDLGALLDSADLPDEATVALDLDAADRLTRVAAQADGGSLTLTLTDPGAPVRVTAPARSRDFGSFGYSAFTPAG